MTDKLLLVEPSQIGDAYRSTERRNVEHKHLEFIEFKEGKQSFRLFLQFLFLS